MTNKSVSNTLYVLSILSLCILTYLLNFCTKIYQCSLMFVAIGITTNTLTFVYGKSKSLFGLALTIITSFILLWKLPYYIDGRIVNGLVFASFSSLMISMYWSTYVFQKLTNRLSVITANSAALIVAAVLDCSIMCIFFTLNNNFSAARILDIFTRELSYKMMYSFIATAIIAFAIKTLKYQVNLNHGSSK